MLINEQIKAGPSITYWVRGEPDPRSDASDAMLVPLQARVRDPLWFLTRQWQMGEFHGADAGSPAYVALSERRGNLSGWATHGKPSTPLTMAPLEYQCAREPFTPDLATRVELGQTFERLLREQGKAALIGAFRDAYEISDSANDPSDSAEARFRLVVSGRAIDGFALAVAAMAAQPNLPVQPAIAVGDHAAVIAALSDLLAWATQTLGPLGTDDAAAWMPDRIEYALDISAVAPNGDTVVLAVTPGADGMFDWSAFDLVASPVMREANAPSPTRAVIPAHVRFRGMPNSRFWDFELAGTDLGSIIPDRRDLARLAVMDFALLHANDWFMIPIDMAPGELYQLDQLVVHDVFGVATIVPRADRETAAAGKWSLFTTSIVGQPTAMTADFFVLPSSAASANQPGIVIEEVMFTRDDMANMAWALEQLTENALGAPWPGRERDIARNVPSSTLAPPSAPLPLGVTLRYQIQSRVPEHWIPLLPVSIDPVVGKVALERGAMLRDNGTPIEPSGRIMKPSSIAVGAAYRLPEEEVARGGVMVQRVVCRSRWLDGGTSLWVMRRTGPGEGSANSALRFDEALLATSAK